MKTRLQQGFPQDLAAFVAKGTFKVPKRQWFDYEEGDLYVRVLERSGKITYTLATIGIRPAHRRQGHLTFVLNHLEEAARNNKGSVVVENILSPVVENEMLKRGYAAKRIEEQLTMFKDFSVE